MPVGVRLLKYQNSKHSIDTRTPQTTFPKINCSLFSCFYILAPRSRTNRQLPGYPPRLRRSRSFYLSSLRLFDLHRIFRMPSIVAEVPPQSKAGTVRPPDDDEYYVMERYTVHAAHCTPCSQPYATLRRGGSLCPRGAHHVRNMAEYIHSHDSKAYSAVAKKAGEMHEIAIPPKFAVVADLMRAFGYGLKIKKARAQVVIHNPSETAKDTPAPPAKAQPTELSVAPALTKPEDSFHNTNTELGRPVSRGSLYSNKSSHRGSPSPAGSRIKKPGGYLR